MASKIIKGLGGALGIGGKKKPADTAAPATPASTGPIIKNLNALGNTAAPTAASLRKKLIGDTVGTILSDKLGR